MHLAFIPYGKRSEVELLLRDMEAQKHLLPMRKGAKTKAMWLQGVVRVLPFGIHEYIFPKEDLDKVLATLHKVKQPGESWIKSAVLRKITKSTKIPKYKDDKKYLWISEHVGIILIGIKPDGELTNLPHQPNAGWTHEAL